MPLIKETLKMGIETSLKTFFNTEDTKEKLRKKLDGSSFNGKKTVSTNLFIAAEEIKKKTEEVLSIQYDPNGTGSTNAMNIIKKVSANEQANGITEAICKWLADEMAPAIAEAVANNVDTFVRSATIIVPPGQAITGANAGGPVAGSTISPSSPAIIS